MKHRNKSVKIYKIEFPEGEKGAKQKGGNMNTNFPGLKEDIKAQLSGRTVIQHVFLEHLLCAIHGRQRNA